ncbi:uncharacterized protein LOC133818786 isoform X2 [Humulus lupulus]|uniref:uncharacterized protein LOC133818786 isoform X2 n=1 Tax=Humulus lupulus TaxID=3486 RepID=UPI002B416DE2|nr:uncharacterized protein LOC133818786 isoform X2 [Humulus lupulus]
MVNKEKKRFVDNLSRKELQSMCKQYGLPANKSHSDLEKSLIAYLEEGINGSICNLQKTSHSKCIGSINHRKVQRKSSNERFLSSSRDNFVEIMPQTKCRDKDDGSCPAENALASTIESSPKVHFSSFEFYVRSEEGINLYVDLNSSPSDWTQRFKNEVHICENVQNNKCRSLHEDLGHLKEGGKEMRNSFWNINVGEIKEGQIETRSSPNSKGTKIDQSELDQLEKDETSLIPFTIQPSNASVDVLEKSKEDQNPKSSEFNSTAHDNIVSVADSCAKDDDTMVLDSDVIGAHHTKSVCDSAVNSMSDDPSSPERLDHLNFNMSQHKNTFLQNGCRHANPTVVHPGCSVSGSIDMQSSEVASCNKDASCSRCENSGLMNGFDRKNNSETEKKRLPNLSESDPKAHKKHLPVLSEEREKSSILNDRESSECSQLTKSSRKTSLSSHTLDTKGLQKRRIEADQSSYGRASAIFFRSTKPITRKDFPRRSMRLKSK